MVCDAPCPRPSEPSSRHTAWPVIMVMALHGMLHTHATRVHSSCSHTHSDTARGRPSLVALSNTSIWNSLRTCLFVAKALLLLLAPRAPLRLGFVNSSDHSRSGSGSGISQERKTKEPEQGSVVLQGGLGLRPAVALLVIGLSSPPWLGVCGQDWRACTPGRRCPRQVRLRLLL